MTQYISIPHAPIWEKIKHKGSPLTFSLELTVLCNNNCRHCYINMPADHCESKSKELTLEEINDLADQAIDLGVLWCTLSGGEPLLRPDFEDIYLMLQKKGLLLALYTNATLIRPKHIRLFKTHPPREIEITVYGATRETYERVTRNPGSFDQFIRALDGLAEAGIPVRLKAMTVRSNLHEHQRIAEFCKRHTKDYYRYDPMLNLRVDHDPVRNREIIAERLTPGEIIALEKADDARFSQIQQKCDALADSEHCIAGCDHLFHCGIGGMNFDISYDGQFRLCSILTAPETTLDLRKHRLKEAISRFPQIVKTKTSKRKALETNFSTNL
jgi:MoaA/NifB/PqqE/SkfB family radical SAM enzyme